MSATDQRSIEEQPESPQAAPARFTDAELARRVERVKLLLETHDLVYDSVSRNETSHAGFGDVRRTVERCTCAGRGCGQCARSLARFSHDREKCEVGEACRSCAALQGVDEAERVSLVRRLRPGRVVVEARDPYDTGLEGSFDPKARTDRERAKLIDDTIEHLQELELVREGVYAEHVEYEKTLIDAEKRDSRGSYRELRLALEVMPRALHGEAAARWLAEHMPSTIRIPRWAYELELDRMRDQVASLYALGRRVDEIRVELSISRRQVKRLLWESRR